VNQAVNNSPNQLRPVGPKCITAYNLRRAGLAKKFKKGDALMFFASNLNTFAVDAGMDTITYRLDPTNSEEMISAMTEWPRFNITVVRKSSAAISISCSISWDQYDKSNEDCMRTFILESLVDDLKEKFTTKLKTLQWIWFFCWSMKFSLAVRRWWITRMIRSNPSFHESSLDKTLLCFVMMSEIPFKNS